MKIQASDRVLIKTYFEKRQNLNDNEIKYIERLVKEIVFDYVSLGIEKAK